MQHDWIPSTLGHGETMCRRCFVTNREAVALGISNTCDVPPKPAPASNDNAAWSQEQIDYEMLSHEQEEEYDESEDCGRWNGGGLSKQCRLAGTEWCDWCCPLSR